MDFSDALRLAKAGERVARSYWRDRHQGVWMAYQPARCDDRGNEYGASLVVMRESGEYVAFPGSHVDLLAEDWVIVDDKQPA